MNEIVLYLKGGYTIFDSDDFDLISPYHWKIDFNGYVIAKKTSTKRIAMHRVILGLKLSDEIGDHINHKRHDNRRCNIRRVTPLQNARNKGPSGETKYLGVTYQNISYKSIKTGEILKYRYLKAKIRVDNKLIHLGTFDNEQDAALAYNVAATKYFGEFANLNNV